MIKNERQYKITRAQAKKFEHAIEAKAARTDVDVHPALVAAEMAALESQLEDLRAQLAEYDTLKSGARKVVELESLDELPKALVQARIAAGLGQRDLADRLGLKEQQIQRYESSDYASASLTRICEIVNALGIQVREDVFLPTEPGTWTDLLKRLGSVGIDESFVLRRFARVGQVGRAADDPSGLLFAVVNNLSRVFGWASAGILGKGQLALNAQPLGLARFKVTNHAEEAKLSAYTVYAHYLALLVLDACEHIPTRELSSDPETVYTDIAVEYGEVNFESSLRYVWELGIPVLPLVDPGAFHGACWRTKGRGVIVLKQPLHSSARWLFDLLHEYYHLTEAPDDGDFSFLEAPIQSDVRRDSDSEVEANSFAGAVALAGKAEELASRCASESRGWLPKLKRVVTRVADEENVPIAALANYLAFRLSAEGQNWWGTAANLQPADENPWRIARDVLLEKVQLHRIAPPDRELLVLALGETT